MSLKDNEKTPLSLDEEVEVMTSNAKVKKPKLSLFSKKKATKGAPELKAESKSAPLSELEKEIELEEESAEGRTESLIKRVDPKQVNLIQDELMVNYSQKMIEALDNNEVRNELLEIVRKDYKIKDQADLEYIISEIVGTGFIERLLQQPEVTDIGWNGAFLVVETPYSRIVYTKEELGIGDVESYINRLVAKYANAVGKAFNDTHPILDAAYNNVRLNAMHKTRSPDGTTISLRVVRDTLAVTEENFDFCFAPKFVLSFLQNIMKTGCNLVISGITGTGKTEIQKLAFSYVNPNEKIITIEDVREMHLKKLYPEKDILSWVTSTETTIADEVKASLRNNPRWVVVSETRGSEAYEMYQGLITGQNIVTTLHAENASKIPRRFVSMIMGGYAVDEKMLTYDILSSFNFGFHIKRINYKGVTMRFLEEIIEFSPEGNHTLFKQTFEHGEFFMTTGEQISEEFKAKMAEASLPPFVFPIYTHELVEKEILKLIPEYNQKTEDKRAEIMSLLEDLND